jgi:hypothetical protein
MYDELNKQAQSAANTYASTLQQLIDSQNQQKLLDQQAASQRYQNLINQINQQKQPIQQQFAADSQAAYINKMLAGKQISQNLNQMGLNTQGFGVSQQAANETAYGQNLNQLILNRNQANLALDNQITNATGEFNADQTSLEATYAGRLAELQKYISEATQNYYNNTYSQLLSNKQYEDQLAQQAWEKQMAERQFAEDKRQFNASYAQNQQMFEQQSGPQIGDTYTDNYGQVFTWDGKTYVQTTQTKRGQFQDYNLTQEKANVTFKDANGKDTQYAIWTKDNKKYIIMHNQPVTYITGLTLGFTDKAKKSNRKTLEAALKAKKITAAEFKLYASQLRLD